MNPAPALDVYSTFARDTLIFEEENRRQEQLGGPAFFVKRTLQALSVPFVMHTGPVVNAEILITDAGEIGKVQPAASPNVTPACESRRALVSTLFQEWDPVRIAVLAEHMYLDVQGFVRAPGSFGKKETWIDFQGEWTQKIVVMKATEQELHHLPSASVEEQKSRILLVTKGRAGVTAYVGGKKIEFVPPKIVESPHALGAGDTFFAAVVGSMIQGLSVDQAIHCGMGTAASLLENGV